MDASATAAAPELDVLALRRAIYAKGAVTRDDLNGLIAATRAPGFEATPAFDDLLAEAAADLLVQQAEPARYVSGEEADHLIRELAAAGLAAATQKRLLVGVLRQAVCVPTRLAAFAVAAFEQAITARAEGVSADDVEALRIAVFAPTDTSSLHVTRDSADALFRIAHATRAAANDASFAEFFAKAVGDHLMGIAFRWTPAAADEVQKERWLEAEPPGLGGFLGRMLGDGDRSLDAAAFESPIEANEALIRRETEADASERARAQAIEPAEAAWILSRLGEGGASTEAERALLDFLGSEATAMPQRLRALIDERAAAAPHAPS